MLTWDPSVSGIKETRRDAAILSMPKKHKGDAKTSIMSKYAVIYNEIYQWPFSSLQHSENCFNFWKKIILFQISLLPYCWCERFVNAESNFNQSVALQIVCYSFGTIIIHNIQLKNIFSSKTFFGKSWFTNCLRSVRKQVLKAMLLGSFRQIGMVFKQWHGILDIRFDKMKM